MLWIIDRSCPVLYLKYSEQHPESNIATKISQAGQVGVKIDESRDQAVVGRGELVPGWDLGLVGGCPGERRKIMMNHEMAYGRLGAFRVVPPQVSPRSKT